tara:strand:+ start:54 stop:842 length:789 start_codon:yes stop_codon:yes gene_type:complete
MKNIHITPDLKLIIDCENIDFKSDKGFKYKKNIENFRKIVKESFYYSNDVYCYLEIKHILSKEDFLRDFFIDTIRYHTHYSNIYSVKDSDIDLDTFYMLDTFKEKIEYVRYFYNVLVDLYFSCDEIITEISEDYIDKQFTIYTEKWINEMLKDEYIIYLKNINNRKSIEVSNKQNTKAKGILKQKTYILKDNNTGYYKIGKSNNPLNREKTLQSEKPTYTLIKTFKNNIEKDLHNKYKKERIRGEWFNINNIQLKYICTNYK